MQHLSIDYEYIESLDKTYYNLICCVVMDLKTEEIWRFDIRQDKSALVSFLTSFDQQATIFYGYNITTAEVPVTCQLTSVEFVMGMRWVDLWTEFKMFALTHPKFYSQKTGLAGCIKTFGLEEEYIADKSNTRDVILYNPEQRNRVEKHRKNRLESNSFFYTSEEYEQIIFYCAEDVKILKKIREKLVTLWTKYGVTPADVYKRGEHAKLAGVSYHACPGYPMDVHKVTTVFENVAKIKNHISEDCNNKTGFEIYQAQHIGPVKHKIFTHYSFNMNNFTRYIETKGLLGQWHKTEKSGKLKLDEEYLDEMLSNYKDILEPVYFARNTIKQLNSTNLAKLLTPDGFIKSLSFPFNQKTSRTSPKPSMGFVLNLTPWLRMLIHPPKGFAFVGIDFKSQEVLVAALISGDQSMLEDYLTDIYMGQAIKTGFAPPEATKKTHPDLRKGFKPISLGVSYLMGANTLSIRFKNLYDLIGQEKTLAQCKNDAEKFLDKYKRVYFKYAQFVDKHFDRSRSKGYFKSLDNWYYFVDSNVRETQLQNVPCQSAGAAMTREAHDRCVKDGIYPIMLHDALYFYCQESDAVELSKIVSRHMCEASRDLLGDDYMQTETTIFTHDEPYYDPRGEHIYKIIMNELGLNCPNTFNKPKEIPDIHKVTNKI